MQPRRFEKSLPVKISEEARNAASLELVTMVNNLRDLESEKKQVYTAWRDRIKDAKGRVSHAAEMLGKGLATKTVEVEERYDLEAAEATITRLDTGEVDGVRPMTQDALAAAEAARQLELG